ncbi:acyl-homoserine-lactone synthase [Paraburkholderia strydomiana]|uniref:acyl-homoserine-lactone synthase n=1 Tax=Paraburkholderia strydomiana TaxID=1245417 RepID=UPI0038BDCE2A
MSSILAGRLDDLPSDIRHRLGAFRHKIFVQRLHWEIPGVSHDATSEWDEFDGDATVHLVALSTDDEVCGCARLMPTTGRHLLRDVFPDLADPGSLRSSPSIWEMSRFAGSGLPDHQMSSMSGMALFPYAMALALSFGATGVIGVVSRSVARLYRRFGLDLRDIGVCAAPVPTDIVACSIDLCPATFSKLQCNPLILMDSITRFGQFPLPEAGPRLHSHPPETGARSECVCSEALPTVCDNVTIRTHATI